jgi:DedD protein
MFKQKREPASDKPTLEPVDPVQQARTRARQRLIGAIVLLAIGIIGFPLVFETQPRPIPVDVPIEIPRRDALPPLAVPPARTPPRASTTPAPDAGATGSSEPSALANPAPPAATHTAPADGVMTESSADAGREIGAAPRAPAAERAAPRVAHAASASEPARHAASSAVAVATPTPSASHSAAEGERARALLEGRASTSVDEQRFVIQVGAFADPEAARETRKNVEKLGLKTYTQVAQTAAGHRIRVRVGPFSSRGEAEAALAKAKAAGLSAVLLTL